MAAGAVVLNRLFDSLWDRVAWLPPCPLSSCLLLPRLVSLPFLVSSCVYRLAVLGGILEVLGGVLKASSGVSGASWTCLGENVEKKSRGICFWEGFGN